MLEKPDVMPQQEKFVEERCMKQWSRLISVLFVLPISMFSYPAFAAPVALLDIENWLASSLLALFLVIVGVPTFLSLAISRFWYLALAAMACGAMVGKFKPGLNYSWAQEDDFYFWLYSLGGMFAFSVIFWIGSRCFTGFDEGQE